VIVADTGAIVALVDSDDRHHRKFLSLFDEDPGEWLVPWAILPEVDYLLAKYVGKKAEVDFVSDLAKGAFRIEWGDASDLDRAEALVRKYRDLGLGLVDGVVIAVAERKKAEAIATLDLRHFGTVSIRGRPRLLPRDLP